LKSRTLQIFKKFGIDFKGFAPVFCHDHMVAEIFTQTETLCKRIQLPDGRAATLKASTPVVEALTRNVV